MRWSGMGQSVSRRRKRCGNSKSRRLRRRRSLPTNEPRRRRRTFSAASLASQSFFCCDYGDFRRWPSRVHCEGSVGRRRGVAGAGWHLGHPRSRAAECAVQISRTRHVHGPVAVHGRVAAPRQSRGSADHRASAEKAFRVRAVLRPPDAPHRRKRVSERRCTALLLPDRRSESP